MINPLSSLLPILLICLAVLSNASSNGSSSIPLRNGKRKLDVTSLPMGDINVIMVTDVHAHISGHRHESQRDADYGDILSFYEHLKEMCDNNDHDLWFVDNGNWMHGTGLAMGGNASSLVPLLNEMPFDAITVGDEDLHHMNNIHSIQEEMIAKFPNKFVTSNVKVRVTMDSSFEPLGNRYTVLEGKNHRLLVFGFLRDMFLPGSGTFVQVESVEDTVKEDWFQKALTEENFDAILVLAQMDIDSKFIGIINNAIRSSGVGNEMPIQFIAGNTKHRAEKKIDQWGHAVEAGAYLDTLGFVSFPAKSTGTGVFKHSFLDTSVSALKDALGGVSEFKTENGAKLSGMINETRHFLGLDEVVACPLQEYYLDRNPHQPQSLWGLWKKQVAPHVICKSQPRCVVMISSDTFRYGIYGSAKAGDGMTLDDVVAIAPILDSVIYVGSVNEYAIRQMNSSLNIDSNQHHWALPQYVLAGDMSEVSDHKILYDLYTHERNLPEIVQELDRLLVKGLDIKATGDKDTLYWLDYVASTWRCGKKKKIIPWFANQKKLQVDDEYGGDSGNKEEWKLPDDGEYHGYIPNNGQEIKHVSDKPVLTAQEKLRLKQEELKRKKAQNKKLRKNILKAIGLTIAAAILAYPLYYLVRTILCPRRRGEFDSDDDGIMLYDPKELKALTRSKQSKRSKNGPRKNQPSEIEIT